MELLDARRLTGPNVVMGGPGAIIDVACEQGDTDRVIDCWRAQVARMLNDLGWSDSALFHRKLQGGVSLAFAAPVDVLYAATAVNEWAFAATAAELDGSAAPDYATALEEVREAISEECNPRLLTLAEQAREHDVTLLWDDDEVSLGMGRSAQTWAARELPEVDGVDWPGFRDVPVGLITGTNGKTTTVRLVRHILAAGGRTPGLSSTDWIAVGDEVVDRGDWSGPGGARTVLRDSRIDIAVLETARGGLLRRGLGVDRADAALVTNIAEDHLGDFGSGTIDELLDIKWVVSRAVRENGTLILNADDARLVERAATHDGALMFFSLHADNPVVQAHIAAGGTAFVLDSDTLMRVQGGQQAAICEVAEVPIALAGAARHNLANALAAAALCDRLGLPLQAIRDGITSMTARENPGRCNLYTLPQCRVLVDFAHNPHAMQALFDMAQALPARRRILAFSQAGDRTDRQIHELAKSAWDIGLAHVIVSELPEYRRGREAGEVYGLIREALLSAGAESSQISHHEHETESLDAALAAAAPGDLVIMLALADRDGVEARLAELGGVAAASGAPG